MPPPASSLGFKHGPARLRLHTLAQRLEVAMSRTVKEGFTEKSQGYQ